MSTIYFQYTEGMQDMPDEVKKQQKIKNYMLFLRDNKIMIPTDVQKNKGSFELKDYLKTLDEDEIPDLNVYNLINIKNYYKQEFEKILKTNETLQKFKSDMEKIHDYVTTNNKYKQAIEKNKEALEYIDNLKSINIGLKIDREKFKLTDKQNNEVTIDSNNKKITVQCDSNLTEIINKLDTLKSNKDNPQPAKITLETIELNNNEFKNTLNDKKFDEDDEYNTLYEYFYRNAFIYWIVDPSELYENIDPK